MTPPTTTLKAQLTTTEEFDVIICDNKKCKNKFIMFCRYVYDVADNGQEDIRNESLTFMKFCPFCGKKQEKK
ncbi:hypothetical protein M0R04_11300 [Candidatus Dojkabacteria bacterium]|jgi:hypothetical protein|nr:hypothetical protein [Candidatus Dojkabacteria bacterium]